jgi:DNA-binding winged helix-turn-helix (wHTH) protein/TolB-like protein
MSAFAKPAAEVDLAAQADFRLGSVMVSPSTCRVASDGREERVEPRVMQVLVLLVGRANETVTRDQLIDACWGGRVVSDDAVNRVLAQVRALGRAFNPPPFVLETVPKVGVRLLAEETSRASSAPKAASSAASKSIAGFALGGLALFVLLAGLIGWRLWPDAKAAQNGRVEVMRLEALSADPVLQRISFDMGATLIETLSKAGVQTEQSAKSKDGGAGDAELRVAGAVGREDQDYVINAQIIDRASGVVLWSDRFASPEPARLSKNLAAQIAFNLHCALDDRRGVRQSLSTEVTGLYLNACASIGAQEPQRMLAATRRLTKAAPRFGNAHAMHGIAAAFAARETRASPEVKAALRAESAAAASRALALDPRSAKAYVARELNRPPRDWLAREADLKRALELEPDLPPPRVRYVWMLADVGRLREALEINRRTTESADPRAPSAAAATIELLGALGDLRSAEAELAKAETAFPGEWTDVRWDLAAWWRRPAAAAAADMRRLPSIEDPSTVRCFTIVLAEIEQRRASHARGLPDACARAPVLHRVRLLAREGDVDGAYAALADGSALTPGNLMVLFFPEMASFRADSRFLPLTARLGLLDYWRKSGHWPDFCGEPNLPYDCRKAG